MTEEKKEDKTITAPPLEEKEWDLELIDKTNAAAVDLEKANMKLQKQILIAKRLETESMLGGKSEAAVIPPKEETPKEYAEKVMANEKETK